MDMHLVRPRLIGLAGSLRRDSYCRAVLRALQAELAGDADLDVRDLALPLYNEDEDGPAAPATVQDFRAAIASSDAVLIVTPEYNHGIPGLLKNAIDWASRPYGEAALTAKPVLAMSASPAFTGGVRAQAQLNEALLAVQASLLPGPQIVIAGIADKVRDGRLVDGSELRFAATAVRRLIAEGARSRALRRASAVPSGFAAR